jgi:polar amino acid transport system permease protein
VHEAYGFLLAVLTFAIVFGRLRGQRDLWRHARRARAQMETAEAYGMTHRQAFWRVLVPQMWVYACRACRTCGWSSSRPRRSVPLGVQDIVYWARDLGGSKTPQFTDYPHGDWRMWYFLFLSSSISPSPASPSRARPRDAPPHPWAGHVAATPRSATPPREVRT